MITFRLSDAEGWVCTLTAPSDKKWQAALRKPWMSGLRKLRVIHQLRVGVKSLTRVATGKTIGMEGRDLR
jgi:hypothetical protein